MKRRSKGRAIVLLLVLTIGIPLFPASAAIEENAVNKIDSQLWKAMDDLSAGEKLPVYLWTQDVDHGQIERQVEIRSGLTIDNIQLDTKKQLDIDAVDLSFTETNDLVKANEQMDAALEKTEAIREQKRVLADTYIAEKRRAYTAEYTASNKKQLQALKVQDSDILFQSQYSPMVVVNMTADEIDAAARANSVVALGLCKEAKVQDCSIASSMQTVHADQSVTMLTGSGVKIGQMESGIPNNKESDLRGKVVTVTTQYGSDVSVTKHATHVARILHSVAPDAQIYSVGNGAMISPAKFFYNVETLLDLGVSVINMSAGWERQKYSDNDDYWYTIYEQWLDHVSGTHEVTFVQGAGNNGIGTPVLQPGLAHNVITVGAVDDGETGSVLTDDCLYSGSCSGNGGDDGCAKPDLLAPGTKGYEEKIYYQGTSYAAPIVAGLAAQMMEYDSSLKGRARPVKAILSASCDRKVGNKKGGSVETMEEGLTGEQGAGVVNAMRMYAILLQGNYLSGNLSSRSYTAQISLKGPCNVSAVWLRENGVSNHTSGAVSTAAYTNCDLYLYSPSGQQLESQLRMSSTEMIYRNSLAYGTYTVQLYKESGDVNKTIWFAIAWFA